MGKTAGTLWVRKPPAHFRESEEALVGAAGEKGGKSTEKYHLEPQLDEDMEELLQRGRELLASQHRGVGNKRDLNPPKQCLVKRQKTRQEVGEVRLLLQENSDSPHGCGAAAARMAPPAKHKAAQAPKGSKSMAKTRPSTLEVHSIKANERDALGTEGPSKGSSDDLDSDQGRVPRDSRVVTTEPTQDQDQWTAQLCEEPVRHKAHMQCSMGVASGNIANFGTKVGLVNNTQLHPHQGQLGTWAVGVGGRFMASTSTPFDTSRSQPVVGMARHGTDFRPG
ncbi:hypothetical protein NDU88_004456 [Pleurodeles waltl]|uniref:Uncharacterized protein n=1 Tax=Pleurodeles waltl TaxID=8319 RepID=A0AAV7NTR8_PLEWA|nr:hypothetical protein NDU88_004456 [Pleurodeles waltl]